MDTPSSLALREKGCRSYDYIGRYGGEEFLIVLPDCPPGQNDTYGHLAGEGLGLGILPMRQVVGVHSPIPLGIRAPP